MTTLNLNTNILHPAWVTGFIDGEGTFYVGIYPKSDMKTGYQVTLEFSITQHIRDEFLMSNLVAFFKCGYIAPDGKTKVQFRIRNMKDLKQQLFTLLDVYPLQTQKKLDLLAFREVHLMMLNKEHLTIQGINRIREIKSTMNRGRMTEYNSK